MLLGIHHAKFLQEYYVILQEFANSPQCFHILISFCETPLYAGVELGEL